MPLFPTIMTGVVVVVGTIAAAILGERELAAAIIFFGATVFTGEAIDDVWTAYNEEMEQNSISHKNPALLQSEYECSRLNNSLFPVWKDELRQYNVEEIDQKRERRNNKAPDHMKRGSVIMILFCIALLLAVMKAYHRFSIVFLCCVFAVLYMSQMRELRERKAIELEIQGCIVLYKCHVSLIGKTRKVEIFSKRVFQKGTVTPGVVDNDGFLLEEPECRGLFAKKRGHTIEPEAAEVLYEMINFKNSLCVWLVAMLMIISYHIIHYVKTWFRVQEELAYYSPKVQELYLKYKEMAVRSTVEELE